MYRMVDIIAKKRDGYKLSQGEIEFFVKGCVDGSIPDYQTSALLMAICLKDMDLEEATWLTMAMLYSGDGIDLSAIPGIKVDKHSTGGVGDKTTLIVGPIVAACGVTVAKMSGRGLGHTGGTIDKLESIPGFNTQLSPKDFIRISSEIGIAVAGQTGNLVPADKKLYALRDVTGTVQNKALIAASIMSKKLASGADAIVLDVKTGSGAFMKTVDEARGLAEAMVGIGRNAGRRVAAVITDMDRPLGNAIGNALEVKEAIEVLSGKGPDDVREVCITLAAKMMEMSGLGDFKAASALAEGAITSGSALEKLRQMIRMQGGLDDIVRDTTLLGGAVHVKAYRASKNGYISSMLSDKLGIAAMMLGAGRITKESPIDPVAGIVLEKKPGDAVKQGDVILTLHANDSTLFEQAVQRLDEAITISDTMPEMLPLIIDFIG